MSVIGENLKRIRREVGMTTRALDDASDVSRATISSIETGRRHPRKETLKKLADALGVEVRDLEEPPVRDIAEERAQVVGAAVDALVEAAEAAAADATKNPKRVRAMSRARAYTEILGRMRN